MNPIEKSLPPGKYFYVVTPHPADPKKKYLHSIVPPKQDWLEPKINIAPIRSMAKQFKDLELARSFTDFLNRLPGDVQFCISVE